MGGVEVAVLAGIGGDAGDEEVGGWCGGVPGQMEAKAEGREMSHPKILLLECEHFFECNYPSFKFFDNFQNFLEFILTFP